MHLLHIQGSPRKQRSVSLDVAGSYLDAWRTANPGGSVDIIDVWNQEIPPFDGPALDAKYAGLSGQALSADQQQVWDEIAELAGRMRRADVLLLSVPMWNFGIPYKLKHLIDAVSQKDFLFTFDDKGLHGMMGHTRAVIVASRGGRLGGDYPVADFDHQVAYFRSWCAMVGITDIEVIVIEGTFEGSANEAARQVARDQAKALATA